MLGHCWTVAIELSKVECRKEPRQNIIGFIFQAPIFKKHRQSNFSYCHGWTNEDFQGTFKTTDDVILETKKHNSLLKKNWGPVMRIKG